MADWKPKSFEPLYPDSATSPDTTAMFDQPGIGGRALPSRMPAGGGEGWARAMPYIFGAGGGILAGLATRSPQGAMRGATRAARFGQALGPALLRAGAAGAAAAGPGTIMEQMMLSQPDTVGGMSDNERFLRDFGEHAGYELGGSALQHATGPALNFVSNPAKPALRFMGGWLGRQNRKIERLANAAGRRGVRFDPVMIAQDASSQLGGGINRRAVTDRERDLLHALELEFTGDTRNQGMLSPLRLYDIRKDADLRAKAFHAMVRRGDPTGDLALKQRWWSEMANQSRDQLRTYVPELTPEIATEQSLVLGKNAIGSMTGSLPARAARWAIPPVIGGLTGYREEGIGGAIRGGLTGGLVGSSPELLALAAMLARQPAAREALRQMPRLGGYAISGLE